MELAGEKLLIEFCSKNGLGCKDVTVEDKGYDFEVQSSSVLFMVELKSSRDRWQHWENSMTPMSLYPPSSMPAIASYAWRSRCFPTMAY